MSDTTYTVAVRDGKTVIFAMILGGELDWTDVRGMAGALTAEGRDIAMAAAADAALPYDVIARERHPFGHVPAFTERRIGGTAELVRI